MSRRPDLTLEPCKCGRHTNRQEHEDAADRAVFGPGANLPWQRHYRD